MEEEIIQMAMYLNRAELERTIRKLNLILDNIEKREELKRKLYPLLHNEEDKI